jgi:hypothetical protein
MTPLNQAEQDFLAAHGGWDPEPEESAAVRRSMRMGFEALLSGALSTREVADLLHEGVNDVQELAERGTLYRFEYEGEHYFPEWQFAGDAPLPHLKDVLEAMAGAHPMTVGSFMTLGSEELDGVSPSRWLAAGRPVEKVVWLAESLFAW